MIYVPECFTTCPTFMLHKENRARLYLVHVLTIIYCPWGHELGTKMLRASVAVAPAPVRVPCSE